MVMAAERDMVMVTKEEPAAAEVVVNTQATGSTSVQLYLKNRIKYKWPAV